MCMSLSSVFRKLNSQMSQLAGGDWGAGGWGGRTGLPFARLALLLGAATEIRGGTGWTLTGLVAASSPIRLVCEKRWMVSLSSPRKSSLQLAKGQASGPLAALISLCCSASILPKLGTAQSGHSTEVKHIPPVHPTESFANSSPFNWIFLFFGQ